MKSGAKIIKRVDRKEEAISPGSGKMDLRAEVEYIERILNGAQKRLARLKAALDEN